MSLPCNLHDETHCHTGVLVSTAEAVYNIELLARELAKSESLASFPCSFAGLLVVVGIFGSCPPYSVFRFLVEDNKFVFGRTAGIYTGHHVYCAEFGHCTTLKAFEGGESLLLEELIVRGVVHYFSSAIDAILGQVGLDSGQTGFLDFFNLAHNSLI